MMKPSHTLITFLLHGSPLIRCFCESLVDYFVNTDNSKYNMLPDLTKIIVCIYLISVSEMKEELIKSNTIFLIMFSSIYITYILQFTRHHSVVVKTCASNLECSILISAQREVEVLYGFT